MKCFCKDSPLNLNKNFLMTIYNAAVPNFFLNVNFNALVVYASMVKKEELVSGPSR